MNQISFLPQLRYLTLLLFIFLITISTHPIIMEMSYNRGIYSGTILSRSIILVYAALFLFCFNLKSMFKTKFIRRCWAIYLIIALFFGLTFALFGERGMMSDLRYIGACLAAVMIGWRISLDDKKFRNVLLAFSLLTLFVGLMQILTNLGGFVILDQYLTDNKNALGVMLSTSAVIFLFLWSRKTNTRLSNIIWLGLLLTTFVVLLTIRARTSTLTTILVLLYYYYLRISHKHIIIYIIFSLFFILTLFLFSPDFIKDYIYNSFFQSYEGGDVTTGRIERNIIALDFLSDHLFLGNLDQNIVVEQIHNYPLNRLFEFGIFFFIPIIAVYLYLLYYAVKGSLISSDINFRDIGYFLLLVPFIVSMAEPTFPFGPGTATLFNFILFGMALQHSIHAIR